MDYVLREAENPWAVRVLSDCPIRGVEMRIMTYENTNLPQRHHRPPVGFDRTAPTGLSRRPATQDRPARCCQRDLLPSADGLPMALPAQGLPAQKHRLALLRRVAAQRHLRHHPRPTPHQGPHGGEAL